ncbi:MAG: M1 family peptidase, partial [Actinobacteria bacterium]|nr:M1 family peptidase [Actinomycetota bacterium]
MLDDEAAHRLPRSVVPRRYQLRIEPDLDAARFRGSEQVSLDVVEPVDEIVLNAADLGIGEVWLSDPHGRRVDAEVRLDGDAERLVLSLATTLEPGQATLHVSFAGELNDKLAGFYRSVYTDADGAERVIATTQMEATDARRVFPCWDEPDRKATFAVTLVVADGLMAVSNAGIVAEEPTGDGRVAVTFAD